MREQTRSGRMILLATLVALSFVLSPLSLLAAKRLPNFVILFADDLGYGDLGCFGHPTIRTPNLDRMAREGIRLTQFYSAAAVCTPSRAALMTGRYQVRTGTVRVLFPHDNVGLPQEEITIAEALKTKGYATACVGKWHLGHLPRFRPLRQGFDYYYGLLYSNDMKPLSLFRNDEDIENPVDQRSLTERYTAEAIKFITQSKDKPFLVYLPYTMPHVPLHVTKKFRGQSPRGLYGDVIETIDWSVGQILEHLRKLGLDENTLVMFTSDNGPWLRKGLRGGSAGLLREGKATTWEGGIREPFIARWPGRIPAGQVSQEVGITIDIFTTCLALAGVPVPDDRPIDGINLMPVLEGTGSAPDRPLFFYRHNDLQAVRHGPWKMHLITYGGFRKGPPVKQDPPLLYNLLEDPSETKNVAGKHPKIIASLKKDVERFLEGLKK